MPFSFFARSTASDSVPLLPLYTESPPPLMASRFDTRASHHFPPSEPLLALSREDAHLQAQLQTLLDAQSEGLLAGLGGGPQDNSSSTGSRTPSESGTQYFFQPRSVVPVRQPKMKKVGLRGARRGISRTMKHLARIKEEEARVLEEEISQRDGFVSDIDRIANKAEGLRSQIEGIEQEPANIRMAELKTTEKALDTEIHELETRLYEMKARHRHILREIQSTENSVQSKLSSYQNALQLAEKETKDFLARPPLVETSIKDEGFYALSAQRRTLQMARDHFFDEQKRIGRRVDDVVKEKDALDEGGKLWQDVLREVSNVETLLQEEMRDLQTSGHGEGSERGMKRVLDRMRVAQGRIETSLGTAEDNDWKLLVCCIGAELEALVEGQSVLKEAFEASGGIVDPGGNADESNVNRRESSKSVADTNGQSKDLFEDEEDAPGPELLISQDDM